MPQEAVDWLIARGHLTKSYAWQDVWQDEHGHQFTVSRLARLDLLQALHDAITRSVQGDLSRRDWMQEAEQLLQEAGWWGTKAVTDPVDGEIKLTKFDAARLRLIYDTNTRQAYATGLWERVERSKRTHPYVRYITKQDGRVRASHRAWDNLTLPVDDAFWTTHWPPNGWRCRCRTRALSESNITNRGKRVENSEGKLGTVMKLVSKKTGEMREVATFDTIDPATLKKITMSTDVGWSYNPGAAWKPDTRRYGGALAGLAKKELE